MRVLLKSIISLFFLSINCSLFAQDGAYLHFDNITEKDGLSDNNITCFYKDKRGFTWIGTQNGLNRYDGSSIKIYMPSPTGKQNLSNGFITAVDGDQRGNIWVATRKGLNRIDKLADTAEIFLPGKAFETAGLPNDLLWDVYVQHDTAIWIAADGRDLSCYNQFTKQFRRYNFKSFIDNISYGRTGKYHSILRIKRKSASELWLGTTDGIVSFNMITGRFVMHYNRYMDHFTFFDTDTTRHELLVVEEQDILFRYNYIDSSVSATNLPSGSVENFNPGTSSHWLPCLSGVVLASKAGKEQWLVSSSNQNNNLLPGKVNAVFLSDGIIWVGTESGVSKCKLAQRDVMLYRLEGIKIALRENVINNICYVDHTGSLYITASAKNNIFIVKQDLSVGTLQKPPAYQKDTCLGVFYDRADTLYFLCRGKILLYNISKGQWIKMALPAAASESMIVSMQKDADGNYWVGTSRDGLWIYKVNEKRWWYPTPADGFYGDLIYTLLFDPAFNTMWVGSYGYGITRYDARSKTFTRYSVQLGDSTKLQSSLINDLAANGKGTIWAATTEGGLSAFNYNNRPEREFINFNLKKGLPGDNIYSVATDREGLTWFTSVKGIAALNQDGKVVKQYDRKNIFSSSDFFNKLLLTDSFLYTSYDNIVLLLDRRKTTGSDTVSLLFDKIVINDTGSVDFYNNAALRLSYLHNTISFAFTAPHFDDARPLHYKYKLNGLEENWVSLEATGFVRYSSLPPGDYTFEVTTIDAGGVACSNTLSFSFTILPPFWYRWWFIALSVAGIVGLIIYWMKRRERQIQLRAFEKSRIEKQMTELETKALRSQMNPHFVFNSLNSISMLVAGEQNEKGLEYLSKFSRLLRMVLESSDNNLIPLKDETKIIDLYLQMERLRFGESFSYTITTSNDLDEEEILLPALIIHPLVENAVWHGLLHKEGARRLIIDFRLVANNRLRCMVKDNGIGLKAAAALKANMISVDDIARTAKGLQMVRDRLSLIAQQHHVETVFTIEEIQEDGDMITGTKAIIEIPVLYEP